LSIASFQLWHDVDKIVVCHNCPKNNLQDLVARFPDIEFFDQARFINSVVPPKGVAWKLYPPRLCPDDHELCIDNDIVFLEALPEIQHFYDGNHALLLEGSSRNYGRYEQHVPPEYRINSGVYGMPPGLKLQKYVDFFVRDEWEENAFGLHAASKTFDEQGIVALGLLSYGKFVIISEQSLTNCEKRLVLGKALHFVSLNRNEHHEPFRIFKSTLRKMYL